MRIGLTILPEYPAAEARRYWAELEERGYDHGWTFDHLGWRSLVGGPWYGVVPTLTAAALWTSRLEIGPLVSTPNTRHPLVLARDVLGLDEISGGRLTLGVGAGAAGGYDADVFGQEPPVSRAGRFREFVDLLDRTLREDHVTFRGEYYTAVDARNVPGCRQRPRVPFLVAANGPRAMRVASGVGQGWITTGTGADTLEEWWTGVAAASERMTAALEQAGRGDDARFRRFLQTDGAPTLSTSSVDCFADFVGRAAELGFTDVVAAWPRREGVFAAPLRVVEDIATEILPRRSAPSSDR